MPDGGRLTRLRDPLITRVAFVGAGDNPDATVEIWKARDNTTSTALATGTTNMTFVKRNYTQPQRAEMAKKGQAIPVKNASGDVVDGRYPIADVADLTNAMQALGRSGSAPEVKAHIKKRAAALGASDRLNPDVYGKEDISKEPRLTRSRRERLAEALDRVRTVVEEIEGRKEGDVPEDTGKEFQLPEDSSDELKAFVEGVQKHAEEADAKVVELEEKLEAATATPDERDEVTKALDGVTDPVAKAAIHKAMEDGAQARQEVAKLREERETEAAIESARRFDKLSLKPEDFGPVLRKVREADADAAKEIERVLDSANSAVEFGEIGSGGGEETNTAMTKLNSMADEISKRDGVPHAVAFTKAIETPEGKALHNEYIEEVNAR